MPLSKDMASAKNTLLEAREIMIPYNAAKTRYGSAVAAIADQLNNSSAHEAKDKGLEHFKWFISYIQPEDPYTKDEKEFTKKLASSTRTFLIGRGFRFKGAAELNGDLPEQVRSRYEERARLMCSIKTEPLEEEKEESGNSLEKNIDSIIADLSSLASKHRLEHGHGYIRIIQVALKELRKG